MIPSEDEEEQSAGGTESEHSSHDIEMDHSEHMEWGEEEKMEEEDVQNAWFS